MAPANELHPLPTKSGAGLLIQLKKGLKNEKP